MSASVAGFPSINAATACLGFLFARVGARALRVLQLLQITPRCLPRRCESQDLYSALLLQRGSRSMGCFKVDALAAASVGYTLAGTRFLLQPRSGAYRRQNLQTLHR